MRRQIEVTGKTQEEAIRKALEQLSLDRDDVSVEILEYAKTGIFGFGAKPALVRVSYDDGVPEPEEKPAREAPARPAAAAQPAPEPPAPAPSADGSPAERAEESAEEAEPLFQPERRKSREEREQEEARKREEARSREERRKQLAEAPSLQENFQEEVLQKDQKDWKAAKQAPAREHRLPDEEVHDEKSEKIRAFLSGLLAHMDFDAQVLVYEVEKSRYKVILEGEKLSGLIGRRGETLDAIQQLTSYAVNRGSDRNRARIQVDAENYREKREQSLIRYAHKMAAKVVRKRQNAKMEPMNAYERHVVHTALQDVPNVSTYSIGTDPNRRVVIAYGKNRQSF